MNINEFKGSFENLARPTLFKVRGFGADRNLEFMCKGAQLPGSQIGTIEVPYLGRKIKVPGDRIYQEWTMTVFNDKSFGIRTHFEDWFARMNAPIDNVGETSIEGLKADGEVEQLDADGSVITRYKIVGAFPTDVSLIDVSWDATDTVEEFTVTMQMDYWVKA